MHEVAITGIGLVSPGGTTVAEHLASWRDDAPPHREFLAPIVGPALAGHPVATPPPFAVSERIGGRKLLKFMSRAAQFGCVAACEAVADAGILARCDATTIGLYAATGISTTGIDEVLPMVEESLDEAGRIDPVLFGRRGLRRANPLLSFRMLANMPGTLIGIVTGVKGINLILSPWEEQAIAVIREAWWAVAEGRCPAVLVGAAEDVANPGGIVHLCRHGLLPQGILPATAAAYLVFERADLAPPARIKALVTTITCDEDQTPDDPMQKRLGKTCSAAPAILLALAAAGLPVPRSITGNSGRRCAFILEPAP